MSIQTIKFWTVQDVLRVGKDIGIHADHTSTEIKFAEIVSPETDAPQGLAVCSSEAQIRTALTTAKALIVVPTQALSHPQLKNNLAILIGCDNPGIFWSRALESFHPHGQAIKPDFFRHSSAVIHPTADVDATAIVEAYSVIGAHVKIRARAWIGPHCVVEDYVKIGEDSRLQSHIFVGSRTEMGRRVQVRPHTVIGSAGFGLSHDQRGHHFQIPQVGKVIIGDDVWIGALCNIDRATLSETRIEDGVKIDSMVQVAHNCRIGKHTILTSGVGVAGSTTIGAHCLIGGRTVITDHISVTDHVQVAGFSAVSKSIRESGAYGGHPLQKIKDALRSTASLARLPSLRKDVVHILKHLGLKETL